MEIRNEELEQQRKCCRSKINGLWSSAQLHQQMSAFQYYQSARGFFLRREASLLIALSIHESVIGICMHSLSFII